MATQVFRRWKRDGSANVMTLDAAVKNVSRYLTGGPANAFAREREARALLLAGEEVESPLAVYAALGGRRRYA